MLQTTYIRFRINIFKSFLIYLVKFRSRYLETKMYSHNNWEQSNHPWDPKIPPVVESGRCLEFNFAIRVQYGTLKWWLL